jgi:hypothetical protein
MCLQEPGFRLEPETQNYFAGSGTTSGAVLDESAAPVLVVVGAQQEAATGAQQDAAAGAQQVGAGAQQLAVLPQQLFVLPQHLEWWWQRVLQHLCLQQFRAWASAPLIARLTVATTTAASVNSLRDILGSP